MRRLLLVIIPAAILAMGGQAVGASLTLNNTPTEVYFSPNGGAQEAIVREIGRARSTILVQAYSFLVSAHREGAH